jgi:hypothetical protein
MAEKTKPKVGEPEPSERDESIRIDLDPEVALRALLQVDPDSEPVKVPSGSRRPKRR